MDTKKLRTAQDFIELARHRTAESNRELFGNIADLFLDDRDRLSDRERSLMTGILRSLIAGIETPLRRALCDLLAERNDIPDALTSALARRRTEIARPILTAGPTLRVPALIEPIKYRSREHVLAESLRPSLESDGGTAGAPGDEDDAVEALLRHDDADLAGAASDYLVAESERIDRLNMPILRPADVPGDLAVRLHWRVAAAVRAHLVAAFRVSAAAIDAQIEAATLAAAGRYAADGVAVATLAGRLIDRLAEVETLDLDLLVRLGRSGRIPAFLSGLARFAGIPEPIARRIALLADGESLAILCKACGVDRAGFQSLYGLVASAPVGSGRLPSGARNSILAFYDTITKGNARAALEFWRRDPDYVSAIEQVGPVAEDPPSSE